MVFQFEHMQIDPGIIFIDSCIRHMLRLISRFKIPSKPVADPRSYNETKSPSKLFIAMPTCISEGFFCQFTDPDFKLLQAKRDFALAFKTLENVNISWMFRSSRMRMNQEIFFSEMPADTMRYGMDIALLAYGLFNLNAWFRHDCAQPQWLRRN